MTASFATEVVGAKNSAKARASVVRLVGTLRRGQQSAASSATPGIGTTPTTQLQTGSESAHHAPLLDVHLPAPRISHRTSFEVHR